MTGVRWPSYAFCTHAKIIRVPEHPTHPRCAVVPLPIPEEQYRVSLGWGTPLVVLGRMKAGRFIEKRYGTAKKPRDANHIFMRPAEMRVIEYSATKGKPGFEWPMRELFRA